MSKFSTTRINDLKTAVSGNAYLQPAINWLRSNTDLCRLTDLEIYEVLQVATSAGGFTIAQNGHSVP